MKATGTLALSLTSANPTAATSRARLAREMTFAHHYSKSRRMGCNKTGWNKYGESTPNSWPLATSTNW